MGFEQAKAQCDGALWQNLDSMSDAEREYYDSLTPQQKAEFMGMGGNTGKPQFDVPKFKSMTYEKVIQKGNSFITLGLDRPGFENSGTGGQGATHCASIDIVAGRKAWFAHQREKNGSVPEVDSDFTIDAARIYLSQKADIDSYFRLPAGKVGSTSYDSPRSAIALKADMIRVVARENIKLVTRTDTYNSQGGCLTNATKRGYGIDLIAMKDTASLQPMLKGENTRQLLLEICSLLSKFISTVTTYTSQTRQFHEKLISHDHMGAFFGSKGAPDFQGCIPKGINTMVNNVTKVEVGAQSMQATAMELAKTYLDLAAIETIDAQGQSKHILSPYNSNN